VIDQDHISGIIRGDDAYFVGLTATHEETRIGPVTATGNGRNRLSARRQGELGEFLEILGIDLGAYT
jgi:LmbE family N-acetylglucosaminyl deacetylase